MVGKDGCAKECNAPKEDEYEEHERTFDPAHMRDFIDVYLAERQRVAEEGCKDSSFYGSAGKIFSLCL